MLNQTEEPLQYKMYVMVPFQLKGGQIAAQAFHAGMMYAKKYFDTPDFKIYLEQHTVVILDGGTTNKKLNSKSNTSNTGNANINVASFYEPDLEDALTSICFLADERVFNRADYSYENRTLPVRTAESLSPEELDEVGGYQNAVKRLVTRFKPLAVG